MFPLRNLHIKSSNFQTNWVCVLFVQHTVVINSYHGANIVMMEHRKLLDTWIWFSIILIKTDSIQFNIVQMETQIMSALYFILLKQWIFIQMKAWMHVGFMFPPNIIHYLKLWW